MQRFFCKNKKFDYNSKSQNFYCILQKLMVDTEEIKDLTGKEQEEQAIVMRYLSLFNELDKYFDTLVETDRFMPYNDKLKQISE